MKRQDFSFSGEDGLVFKGYFWQPEGQTPKGALMLVHGMQEFCLRYDDFATFLAGQGYCLFAFDLRGHGETTPSEEERGFFAQKDGKELLLSDLRQAISAAKTILATEYPLPMPFYILGHSMGSFITSCYLKKYRGEEFDGVILSGTTARPGPVVIAKNFAALEARLLGAKRPAKFLNRLSFGSYNRRFEPIASPYDWLSRDPEIVKAYQENPACTFVFKAAGFRDLFALLQDCGSKNWTGQLRETLPVYLFSGEEDPVGKYGQGPRQLTEWYRQTGHPVALKLYPGGRHEMLNETNREEVYSDVLAVLEGWGK